MPELPEVETVRKQLEKELVGVVIAGVEVRDARCYEGLPWSKEEKIISVLRSGKYLFFEFESGRGMQIHLKMTGRLIIERVGMNMEYGEAKHTRVVMTLVDGRRIFYWDVRMFGYVKVLESFKTGHELLRGKLGPEPWELSDIDFLRRLQKTGRTIKEAILDQSLLAGVGNIYANDGLWLAGIDPRRRANRIGLKEVAKLRESLCSVLERGLLTGGASDNSYVDAYGEQGSYQKEFLVYRKTSELCNRCGRALERIVVGGRGTWVCTECQI